jgi:hypothetical protein
MDCLSEIQECHSKEDDKEIQPQQIVGMLTYWIARSDQCCEQGTFTLNLSGYRLQVQVSSSVEPCNNRYSMFFVSSTGDVACAKCGVVVLDNVEHVAEWIAFERIWSDAMGIHQIVKLLSQMIQDLDTQLQGFYDTYFEQDSWSMGTLYFFARYLAQCSVPRDSLIHDLTNPHYNWISSWFCFLNQAIQTRGFSSESFRVIEQPVELSFTITRSTDLEMDCTALDDLLNTHCGAPGELHDRNYFRYLQSIDGFLSHLLQSSEACYMGYINVASNVDRKWAQVYSFPDTHQCEARATDFGVVLVHLEMGPFTRPQESSSNLPEQVEAAKFSGTNKPHAMALVIDHKRKQIELFEPNGIVDWTPLVFDALRSYFQQQERFRDYKWISTEQFCPRLGIQSISKFAMCGLYSLLWIYLRIRCPGIDREELNRNLLRGGKTLIDALLSGLQCKVAEFAATRRHPRYYPKRSRRGFWK